MRSRVSYLLLFLLPAALSAFVAGALAAAGGAGVLWIFVFGDNEWPATAAPLLLSVAALATLGTFALLLSMAYSAGREREPGGVAKRHVATAVAITVLLPLLVLLHQWHVGNLGQQLVPADNSSKAKSLRGSTLPAIPPGG